MSVIAVTLAAGAPEVREAQIAFHLAAGADVVLVASGGDASLGRYADHAGVRLVEAREEPAHSLRARLARVALDEHAADWVIDLREGEFWWPRGESFADVLAPMPWRYGIVQGLVREFVDGDGGARPWERASVRRSLLEAPVAPDRDPGSLLRPAYRAHPTLDPGAPGGGPDTRQPLRAWYPFEVLTLAARSGPAGDAAVQAGLADGSLVMDTRLRDAMAAVERGDAPGFRVPDVADDAAYAGECAAVGEVDLDKLDRRIRELEQRIVDLETRFWPRVQRLGARLVRRSGRT